MEHHLYFSHSYIFLNGRGKIQYILTLNNFPLSVPLKMQISFICFFIQVKKRENAHFNFRSPPLSCPVLEKAHGLDPKPVKLNKSCTPKECEHPTGKGCFCALLSPSRGQVLILSASVSGIYCSQAVHDDFVR